MEKARSHRSVVTEQKLKAKSLDSTLCSFHNMPHTHGGHSAKTERAITGPAYYLMGLLPQESQLTLLTFVCPICKIGVLVIMM